MSWHWFCKHLVPGYILNDSDKPWLFRAASPWQSRCTIWQCELLKLVYNAAAVAAWLICLCEIESRALRRYWIQWYVGSRGFRFVSQRYKLDPCDTPSLRPISAPGLTGLPPSRRKMKVSYFPPLRKQYKVHHNIKQLFHPTPHPSEQFVPPVECSGGMPSQVELKRQECTLMLKSINSVGGGVKSQRNSFFSEHISNKLGWQK